MAEPYVIKMPKLSDTMTEGTVVTWEKQPGDKIERGAIVATVETDKAIMDVEVFREGFLSGLNVPQPDHRAIVLPMQQPIPPGRDGQLESACTRQEKPRQSTPCREPARLSSHDQFGHEHIDEKGLLEAS